MVRPAHGAAAHRAAAHGAAALGAAGRRGHAAAASPVGGLVGCAPATLLHPVKGDACGRFSPAPGFGDQGCWRRTVLPVLSQAAWRPTTAGASTAQGPSLAAALPPPLSSTLASSFASLPTTVTSLLPLSSLLSSTTSLTSQQQRLKARGAPGIEPFEPSWMVVDEFSGGSAAKAFYRDVKPLTPSEMAKRHN